MPEIQIETTGESTGNFLIPNPDPVIKTPFNLNDLIDKRAQNDIQKNANLALIQVQQDANTAIDADNLELDAQITAARAMGLKTAEEIQAYAVVVPEVRNAVDAVLPPTPVDGQVLSPTI